MRLSKKIDTYHIDLLYDLESRFMISESYKMVLKNVLSGEANIDNEKFDKYIREYIESFSETQLYRNRLVSSYIPVSVQEVSNLVNFINQSIDIETDDKNIQKILLDSGYEIV